MTTTMTRPLPPIRLSTTTQLERAFWDACDRLDNLASEDQGDLDRSYYEARDDLFAWLDSVAALAGVDVAQWIAESAGFPWEP